MILLNFIDFKSKNWDELSKENYKVINIKDIRVPSLTI